MNPVRREPALAAGALLAAVLALLVAYGVLDGEKARLWGALGEMLIETAVVLLPLAATWAVRQQVFTKETIRQAGYNPEAVEQRADDPRVQPFEEPKA